MAAFVPQIGTRIAIPQDLGKETSGVIKFVGETETKDGPWVGVELDTPTGRHGGVVNGVEYFKCKPNCGIFVRPDVVKPAKDQDRYNDNMSNIRKANLEDTTIPRAMENISLGESSNNAAANSSTADISLFSMHTRAFIFDKTNQSWIELGSGDTHFKWSHQHSKFNIHIAGNASAGRPDILDHLVDPSTKVEDSVIAQQSWVFRAFKRSSMTKDVLCLQFTSVHEARVFVSTFEGCRDSMLKVAKSHAPPHVQQNNQHIPRGAVQHATNMVIDDSLNQVPSQTRVMRRRLTVSGSDPMLDGYKEGASMEPNSPQPGSPRKVRRSFFSDVTANMAALGGGGEVVAYTGVSRKGLAPYNPDKQNQDSMIMQQLPKNGNSNGELLLAVFDGHGENGHIISRHFAARIPQLLALDPDFKVDDLTGKVMANALKIAEREIINDRSVDTTLSGTTAVVSVLRGDTLFVANVGDSRIVKGMASGNSPSDIKAVDLSNDHKPDLPAEHARIKAAGGRVFAMKYDDGIDGPARVWLSYADMPGLAMSRSLCDTVGKEAGVSSDAELHVHKLSPKDRYIVLATDGLWEFMESQEVGDIVNKAVGVEDSPDPRIAITHLVKESNKRWRREEPVIDDTTVILAYFK